MVGAGFIAWSYFKDIRSGKENAMAKIATISSTIAINTNTKHVQRVIDRYPIPGALRSKTHDAWYYTTHVNLVRSVDANHLSLPVTILVKQGNSIQELISSDKKIDFRKDYGKESHIISHYFQGGGSAELIDASVPRWLSINPILNEKNETIAAVCVEMPYTDVEAQALSNLYRNVAFVFLLILIPVLLSKRSLTQLMSKDAELSNRLQKRNKTIEDGLEYAVKITSSLIPKPEELALEFDDYFLINKPKDRISGDFHWFKRLDEHRILLAVSDCTGHGVPGGMMVAIGCSALNEVVTDMNWKDPAQILGQLNRKIIDRLSQEDSMVGKGDGMDLALALIDERDRTILFAGAYRPLFWVSEGELTIINGNRQPIGGNQFGKDRKFSCHRISYRKSDRIYMFSDGYVDQFGGPEQRKFLTSRFKELLSSSHELSLAQQAKLLENTFEQWKGENEQVDDVCLMAVELN